VAGGGSKGTGRKGADLPDGLDTVANRKLLLSCLNRGIPLREAQEGKKSRFQIGIAPKNSGSVPFENVLVGWNRNSVVVAGSRGRLVVA